MPRPIQLPDLVRQLRRWARIQGAQQFELDELVSPVAIVGDLTAGPQERYYARTASVTASGGGRPAVQLLNPPGSPVVVRVIAATVAFTANGSARATAQDAPFPTAAGAGHPLDRGSLPTFSSAQVRSSTSAPACAATGFWNAHGVQFATVEWRPTGLLLPPGRGVGICQNNVDVAFAVSWEWSEFGPTRD